MVQNIEKGKVKPYSTSSLKYFKPAEQEPLMDKFQKWGEKNPKGKAAVQILDPTGITSHKDAKKTWNDGKLNGDDAMAALSVVPVLGKLAKLGKLEKASSTYVKSQKVLKVTRVANKVSDVNDATIIADSSKKTLNNAKNFIK